MEKMVFGQVWAAWSARLGKVFWKITGISVIGSVLSSLVLGYGLPGPVRSFLEEYSRTNQLPSLPEFSVALISLTILSGLVAALVSLVTYAALLLAYDDESGIVGAFRRAVRALGRLVSTGVIVGLLVAGPAIIALIGVTLFLPSTISTTSPTYIASGLLMLVTVVWAVAAGVLSSFSMYFALVDHHGVKNNLVMSWRLARRVWWRIILYPVPLAVLLGVAATILDKLPVVGPLASSVLSAVLLLPFEFTIFRTLHPLSPGPVTEELPAKASQQSNS